ncbi:unnamed protein product [Spodoptera littoralis]|uniref:MADF domain-containing protein n=1 Tax=Spodoptera littoralis TaxID=7109 RepID=A0A9P0N9M3_SPOLI|nr:unnamed protein product [Spodoptera littoralis]CAH1647441.1 unnamed protein product [Spodoptera littoralis]
MSLAKKYLAARKMSLRLRKILSKPGLIIARALMKYKYNPCLWNVNHMFYRHSAVKSSAWDEVVKVWREFDPSANEIYVKVKVAHMRSRWAIQKHLFEECKARNIPYKPTLWYYPHFQFLPDPKTYPKYYDYDILKKIVVAPVPAQNPPDANQPQLKQILQYDTTQITTTNGPTPAVSNNSSEQFQVTITKKTTLMAKASLPDQTAITCGQHPITSTSEHYQEITTSEHYQEVTTSEQYQMSTTGGHYQVTTTSGHYQVTTTSEHHQVTTASGEYQMTCNKPALTATANGPAQMTTVNGLAQVDAIKEPNSSKNPSDKDQSDYLLVIERDQTSLQFEAYELDENAVATLELAYSDDQNHTDN